MSTARPLVKYDLLAIEHAITDDSPCGQPWPPTELMDGWVLVRALPDQKTLWRKITLADATAARAIS